MTTSTTPQIVLGNEKGKAVAFGELDEAIGYDDLASSELTQSRVYFNYELFDLHREPNIHIQRRLIEAMDDNVVVGRTDEILIWLNTIDVKLNHDSDLELEVAGKSFAIRQSSADQRLHLLFSGAEAPAGITESITVPLYVDGNASPDRRFEVTAIDHLFLYGTPQFQARVLEQLALLPGYPALNRQLQMARKQFASVPDIVIMQCHAGPTQLGPGFDLQRVIPAKYAHLLPGHYTVILYDPYSAEGLDGLTTLARMLQQAYEALAPDMLVPTPAD